jgi:hypothetical protein
MSNARAIIKRGVTLAKVIGDKNLQQGWNEARGGRWSDARRHTYQLRYELGRCMYTIARHRGIDGNVWAPPKCTSGKKLIAAMGHDVVSDLYRNALKELNV